MGKSLEVALTSDFVWQYFTIVDTDISKATCTKCKTTVSRGNDQKNIEGYMDRKKKND